MVYICEKNICALYNWIITFFFQTKLNSKKIDVAYDSQTEHIASLSN